jgi:N-acetylglucosamine-6-sulfatase
MPVLNTEMVVGGTSFRGFVDVPVCCPSRTSTLAGRYSHNLDNTNKGWCGDFKVNHEGHTWIKDLKNAGYQTGLFGKYYNDYGDFCNANVHVPADWSYIHAMCNDNKYFGNAFNVNGTMQTVTNDVYLTNVIGNSSLAWLTSLVAKDPNAPFFAYIAPHAPHVPATPAHEYENAPLPAGQELAPRTPNWDVAPADHHWLVAEKAPLTPALVNYSDSLHARRLRSTMSVDDVVSAVFDFLRANSLLENTYVIYSADHGYNLGTFRLPSGKFNAYENNIRVPFFAAGGGVAAGAVLDNVLVNNVDIGPTLLELAGVKATDPLDGTSFASQLTLAGRKEAEATASWSRDRLVFEYWGMGYTERGPCKNGTTPCPGGPEALEDAPSNSWSGLRIVNATHDIVYAEYRPDSTTPLLVGNTNFTVAFNMSADPWQLKNLALGTGGFSKALLSQLSNELWQIATCSQTVCP